MSIPLIQKAEKNDINTSIIAIKRQIERINALLGLSNSEEIDTSIFATKEELEDAVSQVETDLAPVDSVTLNNMHSVTSNAVYEKAYLKSNFDNFVFLGGFYNTGTVQLANSLNNYSLIMIGVSIERAQAQRMNTQLMPTLILKNRTNYNNSVVVDIYVNTSNYISVMFHYVDDTHISVDQINYSSGWSANGKLSIWGIK